MGVALGWRCAEIPGSAEQRHQASKGKLEKASGRRRGSVLKVQSVLAAKETEEHKRRENVVFWRSEELV